MIDLTNYVHAIKNTDSLKEKKELFSKMIDASKADITTKTKYRTILKYGKTLERKPKPLTNRPQRRHSTKWRTAGSKSA